MSEQRPSFAQAVAATGGNTAATADTSPAPFTPSTPAAPAASTDQPLVDPRNGELIDLGYAPDRQLVDVVLECRRREALMQTWRKACEDELRDRMDAIGQRTRVVDDHQVDLDTGRGRVWDPDDLRTVVMDLIDTGVIGATDVTELIKTEVKVNGTAAKHLLERLSGEPKQMVEGCFRWEQKGRPRLTISEVPNLADALPAGDEK